MPITTCSGCTLEGMAAVLGGCDSLTVEPYNSRYGETDTQSRRIARNVHAILREESYLAKVADPAAGTYFLESLTYSPCSGSLENVPDGRSPGRLPGCAAERLCAGGNCKKCGPKGKMPSGRGNRCWSASTNTSRRKEKVYLRICSSRYQICNHSITQPLIPK